jgi:hypothetical protein
MSVEHIRPAIVFSVSALLLLMLVTSASPAQNARHMRAGRPRLVVTPRRLPAARNIAPGDRIERLVELRLKGKGRFAAVYFRARARQSAGLLIAIDRCSRRWRKRGAAYSCPGRRLVVLSRRPLLGRARLRRLGLSHRRSAHLRLVLTFPPDAGNELQAETVHATYSFVGVARR